MPLWMWMFIVIIIGQRLVELGIARSNERWMKARGGIEKGQEHYKWFIVVHTLFFLSIFLEMMVYERGDYKLSYLLLFVFVLLQSLRVWCIISLGKFWNTKIIVLPRVALIKKGPYKYISHPNYLIVGIELFIIPLLLGAFITSVVFPLLHIMLLRIRIPKESKALSTLSKQ